MAYLNEKRILSIVTVEEVNSSGLLKRPIQVGDNLRGKTILFDTKKRFAANNAYEILMSNDYYIGTGALTGYEYCNLYLDHNGETIINFAAANGNWLMNCYTFPNDIDIIVEEILEDESNKWSDYMQLVILGASEITFNNKKTGFAAENVQNAIDELKGFVDSKTNVLNYRVKNIENNLNERTFNQVEDSTTAKIKNVPANALPYAYVNSVGGRSLNINQLFNKSLYNSYSQSNNVTINKNGDGSFTITVGNGGATAQTTFSFNQATNFGKTILLGRKYFIKGAVGIEKIHLVVGGQLTQSVKGMIFTATEDEIGGANGAIRVYEGCPAGTYTVTPQLVDLTLMYGAGNEPTDVNKVLIDIEKFKVNGYLPYNVGEIKNLNVTEVKSVGVNLLNEEKVLTESGFVNQGNGVYYVQSSITPYGKILWENENNYQGQFLFTFDYKYIGDLYGVVFVVYYKGSTNDYASLSPTNYNDWFNYRFKTNSSKVVDYIKMIYGKSTTQTYLKNVFITKDLDAEYTPYKENILTLPSVDLKSAGTAYDIRDFENKKDITNIGVVEDMSTIEFVYGDLYGTGHKVFYANLKAKAYNAVIISNINCDRYIASSPQQQSQGLISKGASIFNGYGNSMLVITDNDYTDVATFKASLQGVKLYYELSTPIETDIVVEEPFIEVEPNGTIDFGASVPSNVNYLVEVE